MLGLESDKPSIKELEQAYKKELPNIIALSMFEAEILENLGNKVEPIWGSRFHALVEPIEDLYTKDSENKDIQFVTIKTPKESKIEIYGQIFSRLYQGKWQHQFKIDGYPLDGIGVTLSNFPGNTIIRGSKKEKEYLALLAAQEKESQRRKNAEEKQRQVQIGNAKETLTNGYYARYKGFGAIPFRFFPNNMLAYYGNPGGNGAVALYKWELTHDKIILQFIDCINVHSERNKSYNTREDYCYNNNQGTLTFQIIDVGNDWFVLGKNTNKNTFMIRLSSYEDTKFSEIKNNERTEGINEKIKNIEHVMKKHSNTKKTN